MFDLRNIFKKKGPGQDAANEAPKKDEADEAGVKGGKNLGKIANLKKQIRDVHEKSERVQRRRQQLKFYLQKAGVDTEPEHLTRKIFNIALAINLLFSAYLIYHFSTTLGITWTTVFASVIVLWVLVFVVILFGLWMFFYFTLDLQTFRRKQRVEDVFPDFLQLTSSNIKAGMTIDKALWYAVRPRFGVLAKEIESVAKDTMSGVDLKVALRRFAGKYDSTMLKRSINLLIEGLESGGEVGDLLNRIAINIQEQKLMFQEMSSNVTAYTIFITFASIVAAPFLFALSGALINVIRDLSSVLGTVSKATVASGLPLAFGDVGITPSDFKIFAIVSLATTSTFSAMMISTIKNGNVKSGIKYVPIFVGVSITLYLIVQNVANKLLSFVF
ncbi:type II secretion system F family protein [Candidatus Woesearchaeota archaeon]|nr:type II secretion system F family protein [Candidatus Woesearchaeota archaeon]MBI2130686.1 type II secretion system F family protein [Candidatus Woesearchaeota archaeon]MBI2660881.1 type II secretion system F family protein [Candidatus Woesearchaeota archaeon]